MLHKRIFKTLIVLICMWVRPSTSSGQELDCLRNVELAEKIIEYANYSHIDATKIYQSIITCAKNGEAKAASILGIMTKDGIGCEQDYNEAFKWFKLGSELGNHKAIYSIGYLYLKGLGVEQDYSKAIEYFKRSEYSMAKHWLGICYYYGYGVKADKSKAIQILKNNPILNSRTVLDDFVNNPKQNFSKLLDEIPSDYEKLINPREKSQKNEFSSVQIEKNDLIGSWNGQLIEYDWSENKIQRAMPIKLNIESINKGDVFNYNFENEEQIVESNGTIIDGKLSFEDFNIDARRILSDHPEKHNLTYKISSIEFERKTIDDNNYLIGKVKGFIKEWKEPTPPIKIVLSSSNNLDFVSNEVLEVLASQKNSFIKLYPNPFKDELLIQYELENSSNVKVEIYNHQGTYGKTLQGSSLKNSGDQLLTFRDQNLKEGIYIIRITVNGKQYTKFAIKT